MIHPDPDVILSKGGQSLDEERAACQSAVLAAKRTRRGCHVFGAGAGPGSTAKEEEEKRGRAGPRPEPEPVTCTVSCEPDG
jgi:hypothetical protein